MKLPNLPKYFKHFAQNCSICSKLFYQILANLAASTVYISRFKLGPVKDWLMDWLNARIVTSADPFRMKTTENFAAFGSKQRKFFEVNFSDVLIRNGYEVVAKFLRRGRNPFI